MKLDYYTLLCPTPISLSVGTIRQPTLLEIGKITFNKFAIYQMFMNIKPYDYYSMDISNKEFWESKSEEEKEEITMFDVVQHDIFARNMYIELLNFYFVERVIFKDDFFVIIDTDDYETESDIMLLNNYNIISVLNEKSFYDVLDILRQICCLKTDNIMDEVKPKFKNKKAEYLYYKMLNANKEKELKRNAEERNNMSIPNIISAVASKSHGLNIINIWETTLFQLYDQFSKLQQDDIHYINSVNTAVWGNENDNFDSSLWYKNNFNK